MTLQETGTLSEFTVFPELPIEIRLKIWKLAELGPRLIDFNRQVGRQVHPSVSQVDPLLATCRDSRYESQRTYKRYKLYNLDGNTECHLRPETDILCFPKVGLLANQDLSVAASIWRTLAHSYMKNLMYLA